MPPAYYIFTYLANLEFDYIIYCLLVRNLFNCSNSLWWGIDIFFYLLSATVLSLSCTACSRREPASSILIVNNMVKKVE